MFISNWITFVRETFHKNTLVRHFFIITDTYVTNIQNNKNTVMTEKEKEAVRLPENAFRELKDGEEYRPVMNPQRQYPEVNAWSVTWGILMAIVFSAAAAYLGLRVGQVFEAAIPIAIIAVGVSTAAKRHNPLGENVIIQSIGACSGAVVAGHHAGTGERRKGRQSGKAAALRGTCGRTV